VKWRKEVEESSDMKSIRNGDKVKNCCEKVILGLKAEIVYFYIYKTC